TNPPIIFLLLLMNYSLSSHNKICLLSKSLKIEG
ncbi:unnamed protein product, partial [marine sediment metagenome]